MGQAVGVRASSLGVSALLLGGILIAALTTTYQVAMRIGPSDPTPIISTPWTAPPPPKPTVQHPQTPRPDAVSTVVQAIAASTVPLTASANAIAADGDRGPVLITRPYWLHVPTNLDRFYPARALERGVQGQAVVDCIVTPTGALSPCALVSETPSGWGFGGAALRIAPEYSMQPATRDGAPAEGRYRMVVPFAIR